RRRYSTRHRPTSGRQDAVAGARVHGRVERSAIACVECVATARVALWRHSEVAIGSVLTVVARIRAIRFGALARAYIVHARTAARVIGHFSTHEFARLGVIYIVVGPGPVLRTHA